MTITTRKRIALAIYFALCIAFLLAVRVARSAPEPTPPPNDPSDASGSITVAATSQLVVAKQGVNQTNPNARRYLLFQNNSATDTMRIDFGVPAIQDQPSIEVAPKGSVVFEGSYVPSEAVYVIGPTAGAKFVCKFK